MSEVRNYIEECLAPKNCDALLVSSLINVCYLTGFDGSFGWCLLFPDGAKVLITDARYQGYVEKVVFSGVEVCDLNNRPFDNLRNLVKGRKILNLGFEGGDVSFQSLDRFKKEVETNWVQIDDLVERLRIQKSKVEIKKIAKSQQITKEIFEELKSSLEIGMTEKDIAWKIECLARKRDCDGVSFDPIVAINEHSASPHHHVTDRKLKTGDLLLVDMGVIWRGYSSDMTRMIFTGDITEEQQKVYEVVERAQKAAIDVMKVGVDAFSVDSVARKIIDEAGYEGKFCHSLGHGVGLEIHEKPNLSVRSTDTLSEGAVVTVEPGVYLEGKFGVRIEDLVVIENGRARVL